MEGTTVPYSVIQEQDVQFRHVTLAATYNYCCDLNASHNPNFVLSLCTEHSQRRVTENEFVGFAVVVCPSARYNKRSAERIFTKFDTGEFKEYYRRSATNRLQGAASFLRS